MPEMFTFSPIKLQTMLIDSSVADLKKLRVAELGWSEHGSVRAHGGGWAMVLGAKLKMADVVVQ